jgi:hypothetical protein
VKPAESPSGGLSSGSSAWKCLYFFAGPARRGDIGHFVQTCAAERNCLEVYIEEVDIVRDGVENNLLEDPVADKFLTKMATEHISAIIISPPCETWSRVTFSNQRGPAPVRSMTHPWGYPWLVGRQGDKVQEANKLLKFAILAVQQAAARGQQVILEHPEDLGCVKGLRPANIWQLPEIIQLVQKGLRSWAIFQSSFGTPYAKPTRLLDNLLFKDSRMHFGMPKFSKGGK